MIEGFGALGLTLATIGGWTSDASAQTVDVDELMKAGPLGEKGLGDPNAPVTIIEYASMTCSHCAHFHVTTYPVLKERYIDTGKVYFIFREFPLDRAALAAFALARCVPDNSYFPLIDILFEQQRTWAAPEDKFTPLLSIWRQTGFTQEAFEACLTNQEVLDGVIKVGDRGRTEFKVNATPTFFVNGEKLIGRDIKAFETAIAKHQSE